MKTKEWTTTKIDHHGSMFPLPLKCSGIFLPHPHLQNVSITSRDHPLPWASSCAWQGLRGTTTVSCEFLHQGIRLEAEAKEEP